MLVNPKWLGLDTPTIPGVGPWVLACSGAASGWYDVGSGHLGDGVWMTCPCWL